MTSSSSLGSLQQSRYNTKVDWYIVYRKKVRWPGTVTAMRGITLLGQVSGNAIMHWPVEALLRWSTSRRLPTQFGGFECQQTLFATQYVRSFVRVAGRAKLSTGSAVHRREKRVSLHVERKLLFGTQDCFPQQLRRVLDEEGFNVADLESAITTHSDDFVSTATVATMRVIQDAHQSTWYTLPGHDVCYDTARGSRPGESAGGLGLQYLDDEGPTTVGREAYRLTHNFSRRR